MARSIVIVDRELRDALIAAGAEVAATTAARAKAVEAAQVLARRASKDGMTDVELAQLLGVDRARTIRRWLGKD